MYVNPILFLQDLRDADSSIAQGTQKFRNPPCLVKLILILHTDNQRIYVRGICNACHVLTLLHSAYYEKLTRFGLRLSYDQG